MKQTNQARRGFLHKAAVSLAFLGLQNLSKAGYASQQQGSIKVAFDQINNESRFGPIIPDPNGLLNLPAGFHYRVIAKAGTTMSDGFISPDNPDGMATFTASDGKLMLLRNHELTAGGVGAFGANNESVSRLKDRDIYDAGKGELVCKGSTTSLLINEQTLQVELSYLSLAGTMRNCAGGPTPWQSWLSCEESVINAGSGYCLKDHGYVFDVPVSETPKLARPLPLKAMGRFNHEAACVDEKSGIVYLTEDRQDSLLYRFIPKRKGALQHGGKLQALAINEQQQADTRNWQGGWGLSRGDHAPAFPLNQPLSVRWIDLEDVDTANDDLRHRGYLAGAALFARGEGMWMAAGEFYFTCTSGGKTKSGQVFRYCLSDDEGLANEWQNPASLELFIEPNDKNVLAYCDNLTITPWGDLFLCEDTKQPNVIGVTPKGELYRFAESRKYRSELAGGVFSPSGKTYFVNIQFAGLTLAIQGPWLA